MQRRLAAILSTDAVGCSRRMAGAGVAGGMRLDGWTTAGWMAAQ